MFINKTICKLFTLRVSRRGRLEARGYIASALTSVACEIFTNVFVLYFAARFVATSAISGNETDDAEPQDFETQARNAQEAAQPTKQAVRVADQVDAHSIDILRHAPSALDMHRTTMRRCYTVLPALDDRAGQFHGHVRRGEGGRAPRSRLSRRDFFFSP